MVHTFDSSILEAEAGGLWVWGQPGLQREFEVSQNCYTEKPFLKNKKNENKNKLHTSNAQWHRVNISFPNEAMGAQKRGMGLQKDQTPAG